MCFLARILCRSRRVVSGVWNRILRGVGVTAERHLLVEPIAPRPFERSDEPFFEPEATLAAVPKRPTFGLWLDAVDVGYFDLRHSRDLPRVRLGDAQTFARFTETARSHEAADKVRLEEMAWYRLGVMSRDLRGVLGCVSGRHRRSMVIMLELSRADWNNLSTSLWSSLVAFGALGVMVWPTRQGARNARSLPQIIRR